MPHATEDEMMGGVNEDDVVKQFLGSGLNPDAEEQERSFDQAGKADDAIDYEDISDDDLPEEQEGTGDGEDMDDVFEPSVGGLGGFSAQPPNGYHDAKELPSSDAIGETDEFNDLFGDRVSSPEEERRPAPPQHRSSGLALPSKSGLALPGMQSPSSLSPPPYGDREGSAMSPSEVSEDEDDMAGLSKEEAMQLRMFRDAKKKHAGDLVDSEAIETDMELFHTLFPGYESTEAPKFIELFPPRSVEYKGKVPVKPPKAVLPTKLSLDLLQDQERSFKTTTIQHKPGQESTFNNSIITIGNAVAAEGDSDDDLDASSLDENELVGGLSMQDLHFICQDWDFASVDSATSAVDFANGAPNGLSNGDYDVEDQMRASKKRKTGDFASGLPLSFEGLQISFENPEHAVAKLAKSVALDLNDPNLLIDEHAPRTTRKLKRVPGDRRDAALSRDIAKRYNISNDQAYDLLKENHQHKVRSTLGSMAIEHSFPATKLQYPFYKVGLDNKAKRGFHRPQLELKNQPGREYRFQKPKHIKRKNVKGREAKEVFAKAEDLSLGDNASMLLLEYSEEAPMMMSNFGMGNRLINYYRKKDTDDNERPKRDIGEAQVLLPQDKSPFAIFGHVDKGETVPTIQNGLYRAPVFSHTAKTTDFIIGISSTYESGDRFFLRNVENLHIVGQQFPLAEVPGQHSRKVTDAAKKRLRALSYRIYTKSLDRKDKVLDNATLMPHLPGHDMPQTRSKMREFMKYERVANRSDGSSGVWVPQPGSIVPDADTLRGWIRPEDVCLLDSMQVGVQHLSDLGISETKDADEDKDIDESAGIEQQLAPWRATKNFLNACQGKAMLQLHGDGDPTNRGEGFSFVKTSMKGGFHAIGESVEDKISAAKRKQNNGHSYNVAAQQKSYDDSIRRIWDAQKNSLSNDQVFSDDDMDDDGENDQDYSFGRANTPRSSFSTPAAFASRQEDDMSQFSGHSAGRGEKTLVIQRSGGHDKWGNPRPAEEITITDARVIKAYRKRVMERDFKNANLQKFEPTGDKEKDDYAQEMLRKELERIQRNAERREAREKAKARNKTDGSPSVANSPGPSDADGPASTVNTGTADNTPQKAKRSKDGTTRKCANCGQAGHIKTNRKLCPLLNGTMKPEDAGMNGDSSFGAVPAPLTL
ncbi:hypothetical protein M409DRAFT_64840 [Zasmidium cellare ATCC 36951]|uniref:Transcription initiation factor TFIID subunit 1 histone acetyltransferase domain-containing protein n=1 Tax=Zasmidium cellare ATCC 36951 TaxID=1080233 RepID=A0A6A6CWF7_ZASCE|nr:uncharacterized protein M409DRAFT_64840 [Zasmidium cellare ATCC 36951]KAF2169846.1 hypothetical protein M409DRAFT_64840 [Zasmidium cellare ATCC 36951]